MATMTIRLPDEKHQRLQQLAASQGVSLNRLVDDLSSVALAQYDAEVRFQVLAGKAGRKQHRVDPAVTTLSHGSLAFQDEAGTELDCPPESGPERGAPAPPAPA